MYVCVCVCVCVTVQSWVWLALSFFFCLCVHRLVYMPVYMLFICVLVCVDTYHVCLCVCACVCTYALAAPSRAPCLLASRRLRMCVFVVVCTQDVLKSRKHGGHGAPQAGSVGASRGYAVLASLHSQGASLARARRARARSLSVSLMQVVIHELFVSSMPS